MNFLVGWICRFTFVYCHICSLLLCILSRLHSVVLHFVTFLSFFFAFDHSWLFVKIAFLLTFSFSSFMVNIRLFVREKITKIVILWRNFFFVLVIFSRKKSQFDEKSTKIVMFLQTSHFFVIIPHFFFIWSTL